MAQKFLILVRKMIPLLACALFFVSCGKSSERLGNEALRVGDFDRAIKKFAEALDESPADRDARYGLALSYFGKAEAAEKINQRSLDLWTKAESEFRILSKIDNSAAKKMHSTVLFYLARATIAKDPQAKVLGILDESIALDSSNAFSFNLKALVLQGMGEVDEAKAIFIRILSEYPDFAPAYSNLGNLYWEAGQIEDAWDIWSMGVIQFPKNRHLKYWTKVAEDSLKNRVLEEGK
ncbi:MAG: tetratricopeptide repeat protein [Fibrobacteraceae bacterium]|nr:tetratricopeptide repeat protein [Fibrobacteraceae bacterium]